ncbi:hypothetical protein [uncultured Rhodospira sp.]|uniref:hypothetical protein n=1 Tax=uncultured Rhodospira sp. TaxID=1936189 RepID=UPI0026243D9C|nr:hypothetical protein [uncultured Rhodospira sp.]
MRRTAPSLRRRSGRARLAGNPSARLTAVATALMLGCAMILSPAPSVADEKPPALQADMPPLPVLDRSLDPSTGLGRIAHLVRQRVVGTLSLLGSLIEGDIIATDGPITAREMPDGGARVLFVDLTMRAGTAAGEPVVIRFGDVVVDAADADTGGVSYRATVPGPVTIYHDGGPVAELTMATLEVQGEIDPDVPQLGRDTLTLRELSAQIDDDMREPLMISLAAGSARSHTRIADDGTLEAEIALTADTLGAARGQHDATISIDSLRSDAEYSGVPGAWLEVIRLMAAADRLPTLEQITKTTARLMGQNELGNNHSTTRLRGIEVYLSPKESVTIDAIGMDFEFDEPIGETPHGRTVVTLDGLRTRGPDMPVAVDLGALRLDSEGEGLDVARMRAFFAETMDVAAALPTGPDAQAQAMSPEAEAELLRGAISLVRDMAIGQSETKLSLSGLSVREGRMPVFSVERASIGGGWDEDDQGLLDGPARLDVQDLVINDPSLGLPVSVGSATVDSMTEGADLRALRELLVLFIEADAAPLDPTAPADGMPDPADVAAIADTMAVAGGRLDIALEDIALGSEFNPMGGLRSARLSFEIDKAGPNEPATDARLTFDMAEFDIGPGGAEEVPPEIIPTAASLDLRGADLPLPEVSRKAMTTPADPQAADAVMTQALMDLLAEHQPTLTLDGLGVEAPIYGVEGGGAVTVRSPDPEGVVGEFSLAIRGLDETMLLLQEKAQTGPSMQEPLLMLLGLRGMGRVSTPGTHVYDIQITPEQGVLVNGTPIGALMAEPPPQ